MSGSENMAAIALAFLVVTVSPGPANIALATIAMNSGRRKGLQFGAGLTIGLAFWGLIAATGMGAVLQGSMHLLTGLKIFGGLYLLWLAISAGRNAMKPVNVAEAALDGGRWFWRGLVLNLSNPKAAVAWMAALSMGMGSEDNSGHVITATLLCMGLGAMNYAAYAMTFSLPGFMALYRRLRVWIEGACAALFAIAGFGLLKTALSR